MSLNRRHWLTAAGATVTSLWLAGCDKLATNSTFTGVLRTVETNALEPGVRDNKYYARGIGSISELTVRGGNERLTLVDILR